MGRECFIGFQDLFRLAEGRAWTGAEERAFAGLSQPERNARVKALAAAAGNVRTEDRVGTDGLVYTAFWVEGPPWFEDLAARWSVPAPLATLDPRHVPDRPGCWVVTEDDAPVLVPCRVTAAGGGASLAAAVGALERSPDAWLRWVADDEPAALAAKLRTFLGVGASGSAGGRAPAPGDVDRGAEG